MSRRTLVVRLERLGDLIQTTPLIQSLGRGGDAVDLLTLSHLVPVIEGCPGLARIHSLSATDLLNLDDLLKAAPDPRLPPPGAYELLRSLDLASYDLLINTSPTAAASWICSEVSATARIGATRDDDGRRFTSGAPAEAWMHAMLDFLPQNRLNLVDLVRSLERPRLASLDPARDRLYVRRAESPGVSGLPERFVAINPGANRPERRWPVASYAKLVRALHKDGLPVVLVGGEADRPLGPQIRAAARVPLLDCIGQNSVSEMRHLFELAAAVVTNDTGAAHIAAAAGAPLVTLHAFGGAAFTGPWITGAICFEPLEAGLGIESIPAKGVLGATLAHALGADPAKIVRALDVEDARAYISRSAAGDRLGGITLEPLTEVPSAKEDQRAKWLRQDIANLLVSGSRMVSRSYGDLPALPEDSQPVVALRNKLRASLADLQEQHVWVDFLRELHAFAESVDIQSQSGMIANAAMWALRLVENCPVDRWGEALWPWIDLLAAREVRAKHHATVQD